MWAGWIGLLWIMAGAAAPGAWAVQAVGWHYLEHTAVPWRAYGAGAFQEAERLQRPVFILVFADWCHWCRRYETEALETGPVRDRLARDFVPVAVEYDRYKGLVHELGVKRVPATLIVTSDRRLLVRFHGMLSAEDLIKAMDRTLERWRRGELPEGEFGDERTCCPLDPLSAEP